MGHVCWIIKELNIHLCVYDSNYTDHLPIIALVSNMLHMQAGEIISQLLPLLYITSITMLYVCTLAVLIDSVTLAVVVG